MSIASVSGKNWITKEFSSDDINFLKTNYFLDEIYYDCLEKKEGLPYAIYVKAGNDGTGAIVNIEKILSGLSFKKIQDPVLVVGDLDKIALSRCEELGHLMAVGLIEMIF